MADEKLRKNGQPETAEDESAMAEADLVMAEAGVEGTAYGRLRDHLRDLPLSALTVMLGGWVLLYLVQNTDNPISQLLHVDPEGFLLEGQPIDAVVYVGGHVLLLVVAVALLVVGLGRGGLRGLLRLPSSRVGLAPEGAWRRLLLTPVGMTACGVLALAVATLLGYRLALALPDRYLYELPYSLTDFEFEATGVAVAVAVVRFVRVALWQLWVLVPLSLVMRTGVVDLHRPRHLIAVAVVLFVGGGLAYASPSAGSLPLCVVLYGPIAMACGAYYLACRSWAATVAVCWAVMEAASVITYVRL